MCLTNYEIWDYIMLRYYPYLYMLRKGLRPRLLSPPLPVLLIEGYYSTNQVYMD